MLAEPKTEQVTSNAALAALLRVSTAEGNGRVGARKFNWAGCNGTLALHSNRPCLVNDFRSTPQSKQGWQESPVSNAAPRKDSAPRYVLRVIGVCLMFALFGLGCVVLALWAGILRLAVRDQAQRVRVLRRHLSALSAGWIAIAIKSGGMSMPIERFEPCTFDSPNGTLIVANHPTIMDVILLWSQLPNACYVMKADIRKVPLLRPLIRPLDYLSNSDPEQLLDAASARLRNGETLVVFPEATRTIPGEPMIFKLGAAEIALRAGADVLPIAIHHDGSYLRKGQLWRDFPRARVDFGLSMGPRLPLSELPIDRDNLRKARRELTDLLHQHLSRALTKHPV